MNRLSLVEWFGSFRGKLLITMMLVITVLTGVGVYLVQRNAAADAERDLQQEFRSELASLDRAEELRQEALAERCRMLVLNPRIHAALEDNALDLLYPSAKDELREIISPTPASSADKGATLRASFYRFLSNNGSIIPPPNPAETGWLDSREESEIRLAQLPKKQQIGYIFRRSQSGSEKVDEVIALPIVSTETGEVISALVVGFKPLELEAKEQGAGMRSGIWRGNRLYMSSLSSFSAARLSALLAQKVHSQKAGRNNFAVSIDGAPYLLFFRILNPHSAFPPAYQISIYPLQAAIARQRTLQGRIVGGGLALLIAGFLASHFVSSRLSRPVEKLALESQENLVERRKAETNLATTSKELQRSARFSADASHQLKSPVTVLRAGIESLMNRDGFPSGVYDELSSMLHQTYRLTGVIDDLLLLSRMDAGRLQLKFSSVDLAQLIDEWLDDLSALPDAMELEVEKHVPLSLAVAGEQRYTSLIMQNLLENARKYNRAGGRICIESSSSDHDSIIVTIGNTGATIPAEAQEHIFERFHRGGAGENISGHGLGLNLARDLARLHGGDLELVCSANDWTEFRVIFRTALQKPNGAVA